MRTRGGRWPQNKSLMPPENLQGKRLNIGLEEVTTNSKALVWDRKPGVCSLWNNCPLPLWFLFWGRISSTFLLVQNTEHAPSRTQLRVMGKVIFSLSHLHPHPLHESLTVYSSSLRTLKALKRTILILFPSLVGFPQAVFFILLSLGDLTTSHGSPCWWLLEMTSSPNPLRPAALWHHLWNLASHLCL